ncbi:unnamed protein product [Arctogadus glacialis]
MCSGTLLSFELRTVMTRQVVSDCEEGGDLHGAGFECYRVALCKWGRSGWPLSQRDVERTVTRSAEPFGGAGHSINGRGAREVPGAWEMLLRSLQ